MTQCSWMLSQVENLTPREIFNQLQDRDPSVLPFNDDYAIHVRAIVLVRMQVSEDELTLLQCNDLLKDARKFVLNIRQRWKKANRMLERFLKVNKSYLDKEVSFKVRGKVISQGRSQGRSQGASQRKSPVSQKKVTYQVKQRAKKDLGMLSDRTKRDEARKIKQNFRRGAVIHAAKSFLGKNAGRKRHADILIKKMEEDSKYAEKVNKTMERKQPRRITARHFLALMLDRDLSENDNREIQMLMKEHDADIVPSRYAVRKEKKMCIEGIDVKYGNWEVVIPFPQLRRKTLDRFFQIKGIREQLLRIRDEEYGGQMKLKDTWKWGFDGLGSIPLSDQRIENASEQPAEDGDTENVEIDVEMENQGENDSADEGLQDDAVQNDENEDNDSDESENENDVEIDNGEKPDEWNPRKILVSQCSLLQVSAEATEEKPERVLWRSSLANCSSSCRPLRVCFQSETKKTVTCEYKRINDEINEMEGYEPTDPENGNEPLNVNFEFQGLPTLFDQSSVSKILGVDADSSCPLCGKSMNKLCYRDGHFPLRNHPDVLKLGFSSLHYGPRSMELLLGAGENIKFKRFLAKTEAQKKSKKKRHKMIKRRIKKQFGFKVNTVLSDRQGNSNTGNAARRFYRNAEGIGKILEIPVELIDGMKTIWDIIRCPFQIDSTKAKQKCEEVLDMYFDFFAVTEEEKKERMKGRAEWIDVWYKLKSSVHKILVHLKEMLDACPVPPGLVSEEAPERNNGRILKILRGLTRKMSKLKQMKDLVNRLLMISDPVMLESVKEKAFKNRKVRKLSPEIYEMLADPENENLEQHFFYHDDDEIEELQQELFDGQLLENPDEIGERIENVELEENDDNYVDMTDDEVEFVNDQPSTSSQARVESVDIEASMDLEVPSTSGMQRQKRKVSRKAKFVDSSSSDGGKKDFSQDMFYDSDDELEMNAKRRKKFFDDLSSDDSD